VLAGPHRKNPDSRYAAHAGSFVHAMYAEGDIEREFAGRLLFQVVQG
jgi:hypothetical protein